MNTPSPESRTPGQVAEQAWADYFNPENCVPKTHTEAWNRAAQAVLSAFPPPAPQVVEVTAEEVFRIYCDNKHGAFDALFPEAQETWRQTTKRLNEFLRNRSKAQPATEAGGEWLEFSGDHAHRNRMTPQEDDEEYDGLFWKKATVFRAGYLYRRPRTAPAAAKVEGGTDTPEVDALMEPTRDAPSVYNGPCATLARTLERRLHIARAVLLAEQKAHGITKDNLGTSRSNVIKEMNRANELQNELTTPRSEVEQTRKERDAIQKCFAEASDDNHRASAELAKLSWRPVSPETMPQESDADRNGNVEWFTSKGAIHVTKWNMENDFYIMWRPTNLPTPATDGEQWQTVYKRFLKDIHEIGGHVDSATFQKWWQAARAQQEGK